MEYGAERWVINQKQKNRITATKMGYWRRCYRMVKMNRIKKEEIRKRIEDEKKTIKFIDEKGLIC